MAKSGNIVLAIPRLSGAAGRCSLRRTVGEERDVESWHVDAGRFFVKAQLFLFFPFCLFVVFVVWNFYPYTLFLSFLISKANNLLFI